MDKIKNKIEEIKNNMTPAKVLVSSIVLVVLLSVIGISWAWFSALDTAGDVQGVTVETANLSIVYNSGPEYEANNILPGWSGSKSFTVTNNGDREATYSIVWESFTNTFNNKGDMVYSITSTNSGGTLSETQLPNTGTNLPIISNVTIPENTTQTYTITFRYINRTSTQNDQGSLIRGKIIINEGAITPNTSRFVYVVNSESDMNIGSAIPEGAVVRDNPSDAMSDWEDLWWVEEIRPFYLKHNLNSSDIITESYAGFTIDNALKAKLKEEQCDPGDTECEQKYDNYVNGSYAIKGGDNGASYSENVKELKKAFNYAVQPSICTEDTINSGTLTEYSCGTIGFSVIAYDNGNVSAWDSNNGCDVLNGGSSSCNR